MMDHHGIYYYYYYSNNNFLNYEYKNRDKIKQEMSFVYQRLKWKENFVFWFGAQFNSTLNFTQSG